MKYFEKLDKFGEKFSFNYNGYDKYSTRLGGLVCLIIYLVSLSSFILNLIPFIKKENYTLQFYSLNSYETENITLNSSSIIFGIDCGNRTKEAYEKYFDLDIKYKVNNNKNKTDKSNAPPIYIKKCNKNDFKFDDELYKKINDLEVNDLTLEDFY